MFHIVNDAEWSATIAAVSQVLRPGGVFIVGGHFGLWDGLDVQVDASRASTKRLRSARHWKKELRLNGFRRFRRLRNRAYLRLDTTLPENDLLLARKK